MDLTGDDIAGVVDSFGALTRDELADALAELAFKRGADVKSSAFEDRIDEAVAAYEVIEVDPDALEGTDSPAVIVGPSAFPRLPDGTQDLRHILDIETRAVDRERAGEAAVERLREEAVIAIEAGDEDRVEELIDVSYDIEAWAPVKLDSIREHLDSS